MKTALTIAGSDSSGGAGIQADIKTMTVNGVYAMSVITALTAQNTMGVADIFDVSPKFIKSQIDAVFQDIVPASTKIGMVSSEEAVDVISERLMFYNAENVVVDPVMVATSGAKLITDNAVLALCEKLLRLSKLTTPNIPEAEVLTGMRISTYTDMSFAARQIYQKFGCNVLVKGGHLVGSGADDLLFYNGEEILIKGERIENSNTHGTGCTLSSAISANLAKGYDLYEAVVCAKKYVQGAIASGLDLGCGRGPLNHAYCIKRL